MATSQQIEFWAFAQEPAVNHFVGWGVWSWIAMTVLALVITPICVFACLVVADHFFVSGDQDDHKIYSSGVTFGASVGLLILMAVGYSMQRHTSSFVTASSVSFVFFLVAFLSSLFLLRLAYSSRLKDRHFKVCVGAIGSIALFGWVANLIMDGLNRVAASVPTTVAAVLLALGVVVFAVILIALSEK